MPCPPDYVVTLPSKPLFPGPGPTEKGLETIEELKKRLNVVVPQTVPPKLPELDYIPGRDTFSMITSEGTAPVLPESIEAPVNQLLVEELPEIPLSRPMYGVRRLAETTGVLVLSVSDEAGKPLLSAVAVDYKGSTEHYEIGDAISIPLDPLKLGLATIRVVPPDGYDAPEPFQITLNPGTQEVKFMVKKSMTEIYVAAATVGTLALITLGFAIF